MSAALGLARRGLGVVAPNPAVGCILVRDGVIIGRGWTQIGGRPHAEAVAIASAVSSPEGATAYVTLEPCAHTGKTPPCADALVEAGISRCVIAMEDPDARVAGQGMARLRAAGIGVDVGLMQDEAFDLNRGFFYKVTRNRPVFTLKLATSLDGRIALRNGESKWITGPEARAYGHMLRARNDAILVGINTVLQDNPVLDCRLAGLGDMSPVAIVLDSGLKMTPEHNLARPGTLVFHTERNTPAEEALQKAGVELLPGDTRDLSLVANKLAERGITRVLVEGGGLVHASFLKAGLADYLVHFQAGKLLGGDSRAAIGAFGLATLQEAPHLKLESIRQLGPDMLASYVKAE